MHDLETSLNLLLNSSKICHFSSNHSVQIISQESFGLCYPDSTGQADAVLNRDVMCRHTRGITLFKAGNPLSMGSWLPEFTCFYYFLPAFSPMIAK